MLPLSRSHRAPACRSLPVRRARSALCAWHPQKPARGRAALCKASRVLACAFPCPGPSQKEGAHEGQVPAEQRPSHLSATRCCGKGRIRHRGCFGRWPIASAAVGVQLWTRPRARACQGCSQCDVHVAAGCSLSSSRKKRQVLNSRQAEYAERNYHLSNAKLACFMLASPGQAQSCHGHLATCWANLDQTYLMLSRHRWD